MPRSWSDLAAAIAWGAVLSAGVGAVHGADQEAMVPAGLIVGLGFGLAVTRPAPVPWLRRGGPIVLGLLPGWLGSIAALGGLVAAAVGAPAAGLLVAIPVGLALGIALREARPLPGASLALAGLASFAVAATLGPRVGPIVPGVAGGLVLALLPPRPSSRPVAPPLGGALAGLAGVAVLCAVGGAAPLLGPGPWLPQVAVAGALLGAGISLRRWPGLRWALGPVLLAAASTHRALLPGAMGRLGSWLPGVGEAAPLVLVGLVAVAALASSGPPGPRSAPVLAGGLLWWTVGPSWVGPEGTSAAAIGAFAIGMTWASFVGAARGGRALGVLGLLGTLALLILAPAPRAIDVAQPWRLGSEPVLLAQAVRGLGRRDAERVDGVGGPWMVAQGAQARLLDGQRSLRLNSETQGADRFFGHLPGLLGPPPVRSLALTAGYGLVVDALRRGTVGTVDVVVRPRGAVAALTGHRAWNRSVFSDPSVRPRSVDPLLGGSERWDAILLDLPPPWAPGAGAAWGVRRVQEVADHLAAGGTAVWRLPLDELTSDDLQLWVSRAADAFPALVVWLDPTGASNLLVVGRLDPGPLDAGAVFRAFSRRAVAEDLRSAALRDPIDVLERALADRGAMLASPAPQIAFGALALRAATRARRGRRGLALAGLGRASINPEDLFDLHDVPPERLSDLHDRLAQAGRTRADYLQLLRAWQEGHGEQVLMLAAKMAKASADPTKDLRAVVGPWVRRGDAFRAQGLLDQAQAEYIVARSFSPSDPELNLKLADVLRLLGRLDGAEDAYKAVLEREPQQLEATFGMAAVLTARGQLQDATDLLEEGQAIHPGSAPLLINLGWLHVQLSDRDPKAVARHLGRARIVYQRATALEPRRPQGWAGLALVYERQGEYERALVAVQRALSIDGGCLYRGQLGGYLAQLGRLDEARAELRHTILDCPDDADALNALGAVEARQARWAQARDAWTRALRVDPDHAAAKQNLRDLEASGALDLQLSP